MKILFFDIETSPMLSYVWGLRQEVTSTDFVVKDWYVLCWCAKWINSKKVMSSALPDFKGYKKDKENDKEVVSALWKLLDEADVVIAHNGVRFDLKKIRSRFLHWGLKPPSPYKTIDTCLISRHKFGFTSNRLNDLGQYLGVGKKIDTGGFKLWVDCLAGDMEAWKKMVKYCKQDVVLLEKVYIKIRPYIKNHPNIGEYDENNKRIVCPKCGSEDLIKNGIRYTARGKKQRYQCVKCGGWSVSRKVIKIDNRDVGLSNA